MYADYFLLQIQLFYLPEIGHNKKFMKILYDILPTITYMFSPCEIKKEQHKIYIKKITPGRENWIEMRMRNFSFSYILSTNSHFSAPHSCLTMFTFTFSLCSRIVEALYLPLL